MTQFNAYVLRGAVCGVRVSLVEDLPSVRIVHIDSKSKRWSFGEWTQSGCNHYMFSLVASSETLYTDKRYKRDTLLCFTGTCRWTHIGTQQSKYEGYLTFVRARRLPIDAIATHTLLKERRLRSILDKADVEGWAL